MAAVVVPNIVMGTLDQLPLCPHTTDVVKENGSSRRTKVGPDIQEITRISREITTLKIRDVY